MSAPSAATAFDTTTAPLYDGVPKGILPVSSVDLRLNIDSTFVGPYRFSLRLMTVFRAIRAQKHKRPRFNGALLMPRRDFIRISAASYRELLWRGDGRAFGARTTAKTLEAAKRRAETTTPAQRQAGRAASPRISSTAAAVKRNELATSLDTRVAEDEYVR